MKFTSATIALVALPASSWAFTGINHGRRVQSLSPLSAIEAPAREAPGAGWVPDWEGREGLTPEEFLASDMSKEDLSGMWECPLTRWDSEGYVVQFESLTNLSWCH